MNRTKRKRAFVYVYFNDETGRPAIIQFSKGHPTTTGTWVRCECVPVRKTAKKGSKP